MKEWYFDLEEFKAEPGFTFSFKGIGKEGESYLHLCEVKEVLPNRKLSYTWRYDGYEGNPWSLSSSMKKPGKPV